MKNQINDWVYTAIPHKISLKMKLTAYLIFISLFQIQANTYSQNAKVTLNLYNATYHEVFRAIESQTEFNILYNHNELNNKKQVSVNVKNTLVSNVLKNLFKNTNIEYKTVGKQIVLVNKSTLKSTKKDNQSNIVIKGTILDIDGIPIIGVNVIEKGTTNGAVSDFDGNYTIKVANNNATLAFSYIGYATKEILVNNQTTINVVLEESINELESVVVVGYGTVKKSDLTGSVSSVTTKEINTSQTVSIAQAIQGRAAGVTVAKTSGQPGSTPTVRIRGIGTFNNANPLYIVDGVPINDITNINMADAASVEILKDASATAIYGSRGSNGVILITTKKGTKKKTVISYNTYAGIEDRIDNLDVLNAEQWATIYNEGLVNDGDPIDQSLANPSSLPSFNWKDAAYRNGYIQNHQISASGGGDKSTYYISFGFLEQKGILLNTGFKRINFRVNNTYQIAPKIKIGQNIQYSDSEINSVASFGGNSNFKTAFLGYVIDPVSPIFNEDGSPSRPLFSTEQRNPVGLAKYDQRPLIKESFLGNVFIEADIVKGLKFKSNFGIEITNRKIDNFQEEFFISAEQNRPINRYVLNRSENRVFTWFNTLNYNTTINEKHNITVLLGHEFQESNFNNVDATRSGISDAIANPTLSSGTPDSVTNRGVISSSNLLSFFGRVNYNYDDKYLLTATYRRDGSSRFGANNRFANFPSVALAWNLHNEDFYNIGAINQFKLRVGWGEVGNQNITNSAIFSSLSTGEGYIAGANESIATGIAPERLGNPDLKWETNTTTNIGLDLGLLKNSITFTADYFIKTTSDLLLRSPILNTSGFGQDPTINAGEIENKGLEFTLNYKKQIKDFYFSIGGNISIIDNEVLKLEREGSAIITGTAGNGFQGISRTEVGQPLASFFGLEMIGIFQNQDEIDNNPSLAGNQPGDVQYRDLTDDGVIDDEDRTIIGSPLPDFTYGINLDMRYKQFDMSLFFQGSQGNDVLNATGPLLEGLLNNNLSTSFLNRWTGEGTSNSIPRATFAGFPNNNRLSSRFVEDGSYLRLKNVQIGYTIPNAILNKSFVSKARIYLAGQNLLTFTNYSGLDPELGVDLTQTGGQNRTSLDLGIDRGRYPSTRTISLGLDINF